MRLFIPDIGDKIALTADWTFTLINEGRNSAVWRALNLENHPSALKAREEAEAAYKAMQDHEKEFRTEKVTVAWGTYQNWVSTAAEARYRELLEAHNAVQGARAEVTFPAGTCLTIDRVYIRKGGSEFSSLTFFIGDSPMRELQPVKKGGSWPSGPRRFFARLAEVNKIECDIISSSVLAARN